MRNSREVRSIWRFHTLWKKVAVRVWKFEWHLNNVDAYVCNLKIKLRWNELLFSRNIVKKGMFCDGKLQRSVRFSHGSENLGFCCYATPIITGSLHDPVTWYKITFAGEQVAQWDLHNKGRSKWTGTSCIVLQVPLRNLLTIVTLLPIHL